jgi:hypothetical protein
MDGNAVWELFFIRFIVADFRIIHGTSVIDAIS